MKVLKVLSVLIPWISVCSLAQAQFHIPGKDKDKDKDKDKAEILREKEEKRDARNLRTYEKIQAYSQNKYETDPDFRDEVDQSFTELLRQHSEQAFEKNISRGSLIL